jgi:integrase
MEPSFADVVAAIARATDLSDQRRRHLTCSVRQIAKWLNRPLDAVPARWEASRFSVGRLHYARLGVTAKTLANHKANAKAALSWFRNETGLPQHGAPLAPEWTKFCARLDKPMRQRLYALLRYCSARRIPPTSVSGEVFDAYWAHRTATSARASNDTARRFMIRAWNAAAAAIKDFGRLRILFEPPVKDKASPTWNEFPEGLQRDVDRYFASLAKPHRTITGKRIQPCSAGTIETRRRELIAVMRMAVREGVPIESLDSLAALLHPDVVEPVIEAYWRKNGKEPSTGTIDLGWKLLRMARETGGLDQAALARLDDIRVALEAHRRGGLTAKNMAVIRAVLTQGIWSEIVSLPDVLMQQARSAGDTAPIKAAVLAQLATAIAILSFAPVRLANLTGIDLGQNLIKPGGPNTPYWLVFPHYDVKNRVDLNFKFDQALTDLIDEYVHEFRPTLLRGMNAPWLFPGEAGKPKNKLLFGQQITHRIHKATGLRITPHQFRHAAAAIYLKRRPGDYETVRRILGHRNINTTVHFYCGLGTIEATEQFGKLIRRHLVESDEAQD